MTMYDKIMKKELETTNSFSDKKLSIYIKAHKILLASLSESTFLVFTLLIFMLFTFIFYNTAVFYIFFLICHLLYWNFIGRKKYNELTKNDKDELNITINVLNKIKENRRRKNN